MQHHRKTRAAILSVISNSSLVILKLVVGMLSGSVSVISEAIHSGVDLLAALIAWAAVRASGKPADKHHPFGHGKFENLSGTVEALLIFLAAGWIIYEAIHKLIKPAPTESLGLGVAVMAISASANWLISAYLMRVGRETDSVALTADAWHLRTDVYTSAGVMLALLVMWGGQGLSPTTNLQWIDPVAAILVALLILRAAWELTLQAARDLVDMSLPEDEVRWIEDHLRSLAPTLRGFHNLRTRKAGSERFIEMHVVVAAAMSVDESHALTHTIARGVRTRFAEAHVTVHVEPCNHLPSDACAAHCRTGCLVAGD